MLQLTEIEFDWEKTKKKWNIQNSVENMDEWWVVTVSHENMHNGNGWMSYPELSPLILDMIKREGKPSHWENMKSYYNEKM
jgi:hypothetical protein